MSEIDNSNLVMGGASACCVRIGEEELLPAPSRLHALVIVKAGLIMALDAIKGCSCAMNKDSFYDGVAFKGPRYWVASMAYRERPAMGLVATHLGVYRAMACRYFSLMFVAAMCGLILMALGVGFGISSPRIFAEAEPVVMGSWGGMPGGICDLVDGELRCHDTRTCLRRNAPLERNCPRTYYMPPMTQATRVQLSCVRDGITISCNGHSPVAMGRGLCLLHDTLVELPPHECHTLNPIGAYLHESALMDYRTYPNYVSMARLVDGKWVVGDKRDYSGDMCRLASPRYKHRLDSATCKGVYQVYQGSNIAHIAVKSRGVCELRPGFFVESDAGGFGCSYKNEEVISACAHLLACLQQREPVFTSTSLEVSNKGLRFFSFGGQREFEGVIYKGRPLKVHARNTGTGVCVEINKTHVAGGPSGCNHIRDGRVPETFQMSTAPIVGKKHGKCTVRNFPFELSQCHTGNPTLMAMLKQSIFVNCEKVRYEHADIRIAMAGVCETEQCTMQDATSMARDAYADSDDVEVCKNGLLMYGGLRLCSKTLPRQDLVKHYCGSIVRRVMRDTAEQTITEAREKVQASWNQLVANLKTSMNITESKEVNDTDEERILRSSGGSRMVVNESLLAAVNEALLNAETQNEPDLEFMDLSVMGALPGPCDDTDSTTDNRCANQEGVA